MRSRNFYSSRDKLRPRFYSLSDTLDVFFVCLFVAAQDYEEARRLRDGIERLKLIGRRVAELEGKKQKAVEHEDYESAHVLKKDIDKLRQSCVSLGIGSMEAATQEQRNMEREKASVANYKPRILQQEQQQTKVGSLGQSKIKSLGSKARAAASNEGASSQ